MGRPVKGPSRSSVCGAKFRLGRQGTSLGRPRPTRPNNNNNNNNNNPICKAPECQKTSVALIARNASGITSQIQTVLTVHIQAKLDYIT